MSHLCRDYNNQIMGFKCIVAAVTVCRYKYFLLDAKFSLRPRFFLDIVHSALQFSLCPLPYFASYYWIKFVQHISKQKVFKICKIIFVLPKSAQSIWDHKCKTYIFQRMLLTSEKLAFVVITKKCAMQS